MGGSGCLMAAGGAGVATPEQEDSIALGAKRQIWVDRFSTENLRSLSNQAKSSAGITAAVDEVLKT